MRSFLAALQFLTILPIRVSFEERTLGRSIPWFPAVGLVVGALTAGVDWLGFQSGLPLSVMNVLSVGTLAALTGGFHLDGLGDSADGFLSARPRDRVLEIMRDSRIGAMGVLVLVFVLSLKITGLSELHGATRWRVLILTPIAGRCAMTLGICALPYARSEGGLARVFANARRPASDGLCALSWSVGASIFLFGPRGLAIAIACVAIFALLSRWSRHRIGGFTGDTLGATNEIVEAATLVLAARLVSGGMS